MSEYILAISTCPEKEADNLARKLVESKECACVNLIRNVFSIYHWKGSIEEDQEVILLMKTKKELELSLLSELKKHHSYEVPEFIVLPIISGSMDYLNWIRESTKK
ncbi:MAG: divalent-cation tolerance protein CutA [Candidatus Thorarchaeota archaeon]|jgi:periplasmic divalent cation tolerance protein